MRRYIDEAEKCPFCGSDQITEIMGTEIFVSDDVQISFECDECGSTWDVLYRAVSVLNEEEMKKE